MRLWLIRHFEPDIAPGICYGQTDLPLRESIDTPSNQLTALRAKLAKEVSAETPVYSSTSRRCAEIAESLSTNVLLDDRLRELHFGTWEMQSWESIGAEALDAWANDLAGFRPPGGETGYELQRRVLDWLQEVAHQHEAVVVITHGGVMRALQAHHQQLPGDQWLDLRYDYGQLLHLNFTTEQILAAPVQ